MTSLTRYCELRLVELPDCDNRLRTIPTGQQRENAEMALIHFTEKSNHESSLFSRFPLLLYLEFSKHEAFEPSSKIYERKTLKMIA